jgi:glycerophosphoryl diester phosphodiesterase
MVRRMRHRHRVALLSAVAAIAAATLGGVAAAGNDPTALPKHQDSHGPIVIGHRGASGYRPEHTLSSYRLAIELGADFIEPDLVSTKDHQLVARHEPDITGTTDVASHPEFAGRKTTKVIDGVVTTGWFTTDFTLAELKTLHAIERLPAIRQHNTLYDGLYQVPTLQDDIDQARELSRKYHRQVNLVPEIKHSTFFRSVGLPMEQRLLDVLRSNGLDNQRSGVIIQSFEVGNLQWLHEHTKVPLMQLTSATGAPADFVASGDPRTYADLVTPLGLRGVAQYATYLGPDKNQIIPRDATNHLTAPTSLVADAHRAGLLITPYTFRNENSFLPADFQRGSNPADYGNAIAEYLLFFEVGVDGMFTDNTDTAVRSRQMWTDEGRPSKAA